MELFSDANNSPHLSFLPDLLDIRLRSINSFQEALSGGFDGFFNDPELRKSVCSIDKEDFILDINENDVGNFQVFDITKKIKKSKKKPDYKKNICGYITKRIIRQFLSEKYSYQVESLCDQFKCQKSKLHTFFLSKLQTITGPRHLQALLYPDNPEQYTLKKIFLIFFQWFLKQRYIRYLLSDGKMSDKRTYIQYKNTMITKYIKTAKAHFKLDQI